MYTSNHNEASDGNRGMFIKSMIRINHPDWSEEQIEAEFQTRLRALDNPEDGSCEMCSG